MKESPVLGKVREQFADLEQSFLRNDNFLGARSHLSSGEVEGVGGEVKGGQLAGKGVPLMVAP